MVSPDPQPGEAAADRHLEPGQWGREPGRPPVGVEIGATHADAPGAAPKAELAVAG